MFYRDSLKCLTVQESTNALVLLPRGRSSPCRLIINQTCWCHEEKSATLPSFKERVNEPSSLVLDALLAINSGRESGVQPEALEWTSVLFPFLYTMVVSVNSTRIRRSNRRGWSLWTFYPWRTTRLAWSRRRLLEERSHGRGFDVLCMARVYGADGKLKFDRDSVYSISSFTSCLWENLI